MLVDFGISKIYDSTLATSIRAFTPGFAPPEQYGLSHTDACSDVYALGAEPPFIPY
jgi:serine/threonine protein kinase